MKRKARVNSGPVWVFACLALLMSSLVGAESPSERAAALWFEKDYKGAVSIWQHEAESGDPIAQYNLGWAFEEGLGVIRNVEQSLHWYRRAADQGDLDAKVKIVEIGSKSDFGPTNFTELERLSGELIAELHNSSETKAFLEHQALHGEAFANYLLAMALLSTDSMEKYVDEIIERLTSAASDNHVLAQYALGRWLSESSSGELGVEEALAWFKKAAETGYPKAQFELATLYELGGYHGQDAREALRWYREAEKHGEVRARLRIGRLLRAAASSADDFEEAREWFIKADSAGDNLAKFYIGEMYFLGEGGPEDPAIGLAWVKRMISLEPNLFSNLEEFALNGSLFAQLTIARTYAVEDSGFYDLTKAFDWFLTAALQGDVLAAREVGNLYVDGLGVDQDLAEGQMWLERAAKAGDVPAAMRLRELEVESKRREAAKKVAEEKAAEQAEIAEKERKATEEKAAKEAEIAEKERKAAEEEAARDREREECNVSAGDVEELSPGGFGTGFVVNSAGHLLTNFHVIADYDQDTDELRFCDALSIRTKGKKNFWARLIAKDQDQDLAVLATCRKSPTFARLRTLERQVQAGEAVYAFGFPMGSGSQPVITNGIVSSLLGIGDDATFLQHTAAIQKGNSGGPLFDKAGLIVGVNTLAASKVGTGVYEGVVLQNVAWAVKSGIVQTFLSANDIPFETKNSVEDVGAVEIVKQSKEFTVEVRCWIESE